jgi:hypothetical protein
MNAPFRPDNTQGYTESDLAILNARAAEWLAANPDNDDLNWHSAFSHACERILSEFDDEQEAS